MNDRIMSECVYEHRNKLLNVLEQIFNTTFPTTAQPKRPGAKPSLVESIYHRTKLRHDFLQAVVCTYNNKNG